MEFFIKNLASPEGDAIFPLAAATVVVAATAAVIAAAIATAVVVAAIAVATATEQDQQDDDPAPVATAETIIAHTKYLHWKIFEGSLAAHSKIFRDSKNVQPI